MKSKLIKRRILTARTNKPELYGSIIYVPGLTHSELRILNYRSKRQ